MKWRKHFHANRQEATRFGCECMECQADGEDDDFIPLDRTGVFETLSE